MANYSKELTDLVEEYLTDGIISTKERQVLLKKAAALGVDVDEFDLYIDAQQQKVDQAADAAVRKAKGKTCPFCGASIPMFADKCPECEKSVTPEASKELEEILENLEEALVDFKSGKEIDRAKAIVERYTRKAKLYYSNNPKVSLLLDEIDSEVEKANKIQNSFYKKNPIAFTAIVCLAITVLVYIVFTLQLSGMQESHSGIFQKQTSYEKTVAERDSWTGVCLFLSVIAIGWQFYSHNKRISGVINGFINGFIDDKKQKKELEKKRREEFEERWRKKKEDNNC